MKPTQVAIEITNQCNARCSICVKRFSNRPTEHMSLDLIQKIVNEVKTFDLSVYFGLCGIGESLLHPEFDEILNISSAVPFAIGTNGQVLDEHTEAIINSPFKLFVVSVDAVTKETYDTIRCGLNFEKVRDNTINFLQELRKKKERTWEEVLIQMVSNKNNQHEMQEFIDFWMPHVEGIEGAKVFIKPICPWPEHKANNLYGGNMGSLPVQDSKYLRIGDLSKTISFAKDCSLFNHYVQIYSNGVVSPCCMGGDADKEEYGIGNVKTQTIEECFNSEKANLYRKLREEGNIRQVPFCRNCV